MSKATEFTENFHKLTEVAAEAQKQLAQLPRPKFKSNLKGLVIQVENLGGLGILAPDMVILTPTEALQLASWLMEVFDEH